MDGSGGGTLVLTLLTVRAMYASMDVYSSFRVAGGKRGTATYALCTGAVSTGIGWEDDLIGLERDDREERGLSGTMSAVCLEGVYALHTNWMLP